MREIRAGKTVLEENISLNKSVLCSNCCFRRNKGSVRMWHFSYLFKKLEFLRLVISLSHRDNFILEMENKTSILLS